MGKWLYVIVVKVDESDIVVGKELTDIPAELGTRVVCEQGR